MDALESEIIAIQDLVADLNQQHGSAVVVEGERDARALRRLGYTGVVLEFYRFGGLAEVADVAARYSAVIMLFDGDRKGRYLAGRLAAKLRRRARVDMRFRQRLNKITKGRARFIEQLIGYLPDTEVPV